MNDCWKPIGRWPLGLVLVLLTVVPLAHMSSGGWVRILDDANLLFHEAGHPIFGLFGETLGIWGGTLGQLAFPLATTFHFWRRGEPAGFALCGGWFFENFWNIARYIGDARAQALPLVGGGEHDWTTILASMHLLPYDTTLAAMVSGVGWVGYLACAAWLVRRYVLYEQK